MASEIVRKGDVLPAESEVVAELDRLEAQGDTTTLNEVAHQASAHQEYAKRVQATERANYFGRVKVLAEARIGSIDLDLHPSTHGSRLEFDGREVSINTRGLWRMLGQGLKTGVLDKSIAIVEFRDDTISTSGVSREIRVAGIMWVYTAPLLKRYRQLFDETGLQIKDVQRATGVSGLHGWLTREGTTPTQDRTQRHRAVRVAEALGVDPHTLKSAKPLRGAKAGRRQMRKARKLTGGRLDETYTLIRKALSELDSVAGTQGRWGTDEAFDHLYKAEEIVGRALKRAS